jgi:hypothetical protein
LKPVRQIGGVVLAIVELDADGGADERGPKLGDQFLASIVLALRGNEGGAGKAVNVPRRMAKLVR